jgi:hypothetical protein
VQVKAPEVFLFDRIPSREYKVCPKSDGEIELTALSSSLCNLAGFIVDYFLYDFFLLMVNRVILLALSVTKWTLNRVVCIAGFVRLDAVIGGMPGVYVLDGFTLEIRDGDCGAVGLKKPEANDIIKSGME